MTTVEQGYITISGIPWELAVTRNIPIWQMTLLIKSHYHNMSDFGVHHPLLVLALITEGSQSRMFFSPENYEEFRQVVIESVDSKEKVERLKNRYHALAEKLLASLDKCLANISAQSWEQYITDLTPYYAGLNLTLTLGRYGNEKLIQRLETLGYSPSEIPEIIGTITYPPEHTPLFNSQLEMLKIAAAIQNNSNTNRERELKAWLENHGFVPVNFAGEAWSHQDAEKQLQEALQKDAQAELQRLEQNHNQKIQAAQTKIQQINDSEVSHLAHMLQQATNINEFRKNVFCRASWKTKTIFEKINPAAWRDCFFLTPEEIGQALDGEKLDISKLKEQRSAIGVYADQNGQVKFLDKASIEKLQTYLSALPAPETGDSSATTLQGFSANPGKVQGIARIILGPKDFHKFHAGEILVAPMTSVDFVPLMQQAAAFVTNEGGITSHASIVAREMNKPCIIGTKIATKVLKDGDMVEVDANMGLVKVIK